MKPTRVKVIITHWDGEVIDSFTVSTHEVLGDNPRYKLSTDLKDWIATRYTVEKDNDRQS